MLLDIVPLDVVGLFFSFPHHSAGVQLFQLAHRVFLIKCSLLLPQQGVLCDPVPYHVPIGWEWGAMYPIMF